jgi:hypothetical protein
MVIETSPLASILNIRLAFKILSSVMESSIFMVEKPDKNRKDIMCSLI